MRSWVLLAVVGCGGHDPVMIDAPSAGSDAALACQPQSAIGNFYRRQPNPRIVAGQQTYTDGKVDVGISDPDLRWDAAASLWQLYFHGPHAMTFASPITQMIRHATSPDLAAWTIDDSPSLAVSPDAAAWDHDNTETPSVAYNPNAPAGRQYLLLYSGATGAFPFPGYAFQNYAIGAAFSADGKTFTRLPAAESPHNKDGLVLTAADVYPGATGGIVADPELLFVNGTYHLWFSSFACGGTMCASPTDYGIAHATSTDGIHWTTAEAPVRSLLRASVDLNSGGGQPSVIYDDVHCKFELWMTNDLAGEIARPADRVQQHGRRLARDLERRGQLDGQLRRNAGSVVEFGCTRSGRAPGPPHRHRRRREGHRPVHDLRRIRRSERAERLRAAQSHDIPVGRDDVERRDARRTLGAHSSRLRFSIPYFRAADLDSAVRFVFRAGDAERRSAAEAQRTQRPDRINRQGRQGRQGQIGSETEE